MNITLRGFPDKFEADAVEAGVTVLKAAPAASVAAPPFRNFLRLNLFITAFLDRVNLGFLPHYIHIHYIYKPNHCIQ